jgi:hypothetical protein
MSFSIISPTGLGIRNDTGGSGNFRASRGTRIHKGLDFEAIPGQDVVAPCDCTIARRAYPYSDSREYCGVLLENKWCWIKIFYINPISDFTDRPYEAGATIGTAQDISERYTKVTPHIHLQIRIKEFNLIGTHINPEIFLVA